MCCTWLAENAGHKKSPKIRHLHTIVQFCWTISPQLRHVSTIGKKLAAEIISLVWGTPANFNGFRVLAALLHGTLVVGISQTFWHTCFFHRVWRLGSITARHSSSGRQSNFVALNRRRYLYFTGRPSRWALAHILVFDIIPLHNCPFLH